jgi:hypothetical protein
MNDLMFFLCVLYSLFVYPIYVLILICSKESLKNNSVPLANSSHSFLLTANANGGIGDVWDKNQLRKYFPYGILPTDFFRFVMSILKY